MLKRFENFEGSNVKIWITGVPSGEAFQVTSDQIEDLYIAKLIHYNNDYSNAGFFAFKDKDRSEIMKFVKIEEPSQPKIKHDFEIYDNDFDKLLISNIKEIVRKCPFFVELYVNNNFMGFSYGQGIYFEIEMSYSSPKYQLTRTLHGKKVDQYNIATDKLLIKRIMHELYS